MLKLINNKQLEQTIKVKMLKTEKMLKIILLFTISFSINIIAQPGVYTQAPGFDNLIVIEAENFHLNQEADGIEWKSATDKEGYSGKGFMTALPDAGKDEDIDYGDSPNIDYIVWFANPGKYYVWVRGYGIENGSQCHVDLDHRELNSAEEIEFENNKWSWGNLNGDNRTFLEVKEAGMHTISLCMRHDGFRADKILLTTNPEFIPEGKGPEQTIYGGIFNFDVTELGHREGEVSEISLPVILSGVTAGDYSVNYSVTGGSADSKDYILDSGTLLFGKGQTEKEIVLGIVKDDIDELDETIVIELSDSKGKNAQLGSKSIFTYTIIDPRPAVEFEHGLSGVDEKDKFIEIPVTLSFTYDKPVTVKFAVIGGTASAEDYFLPSDNVIIPAGEMSANIKIEIMDDEIDESTEYMELLLTGAENAHPEGRIKHTLGICTKSYNTLGAAEYFRFNSNERWEKFAKVGEHADVIVEIGEVKDRIIFWRGSSYRPHIETAERRTGRTNLDAEQRGLKSFVPDHEYVVTETKRSYVDAIVPVKGDGTGKMFDLINRYARAKIVESSPARVTVLWRYIPDFSNPRPEGWTEEYFTIYPDGTTFRSIKTGTQTQEEYNDPSHATHHQLLFTDKGVFGLPQSWLNTSALKVDESINGSYIFNGFDISKGSYNFVTQKTGAPEVIMFEISSDVENPALSVEEWGDASVHITVDGKEFENYKTGYAERMNNNDLTLWFGERLKSGSKVTITPVGGSEPVVRAPVPDPYEYEIPVFPEGSSDPGPFGAYYITYKYFELWDKPYRVGDYADVVVQFDQSTDRYVFWRGTSYVPHWINDKNFWYENEFCERRGEDSGLKGLCEPMNEHENRYTQVKIIESNDARTVIHWRYVPTTLKYEHPFTDETGWGDYVDEYYYIYPDETSVRDAKLMTSTPNVFHEFQEVIPLVNPGMIPEDILDMKALSLANTSGKVREYDFTDGFPTNDQFEDGLNIVLVGMKGERRPFAISESYGQWHDPISRPNDTRFNHYDDWPGWPEKYRREDWDRDPNNNYRNFWKILPSHSSLMHLDWDNYESDLDGPVIFLRKILLNGMTESKDVTTLIPLTKYWENAPIVDVSGYGFSDAVFDKSQKAYRIERRISWIDSLVNRDDDKMVNEKADSLELKVFASSESPLINPCFIIKNWPEGVKAKVSINGKILPPGKDFRQGFEKTYENWEVKNSLVVWLDYESEKHDSILIEMN
jgi:hypothetical protein